MHIKNLQKATDLFKDLLAIDAEIIQLEKLANVCADGEVQINLSLSIKSTKPPTEVNRDIFDGDGFLKPEFINGPAPEKTISDALIGPFEGMMEMIKRSSQQAFIHAQPNFARGSAAEMAKKPESTITREISDVNALQILGWILAEKNAVRQRILSDLAAQGVIR